MIRWLGVCGALLLSGCSSRWLLCRDLDVDQCKQLQGVLQRATVGPMQPVFRGMQKMERRKSKRMAYVAKWDFRKPLKGAKLKKLRQMWVHGNAWSASLDDLGLGNIPLQTRKLIV